ncbi:MAG: hypothetical protein WCD07_09005 [Burkholderiales bacterium]
MRAPSMMPYKHAYDFFQMIKEKPHDKIAMRTRVFVSDKKIKLSDVKINLVGDKNSRPIPITDDGLIEVPILKAFLDDNSEFISNQKKNSMGVTGTVEIILPANGPIRYSYLTDALAQTRDAIKGFLPFMYAG